MNQAHGLLLRVKARGISRRMLGWAEERKIQLKHIQPGRPMQNGHVESSTVDSAMSD
jgi:hypothetical protein